MIDARGERGSRVISIDPKGVLTIIDKNALGLEKRGEKKNSLGETLQLWDILYNSKGEKSKRIEVVYSHGKQLRHVITSWNWDYLGRLESITEACSTPDEKTTSITYNSLGQRESITKPSGLKILYSYDVLGRIRRWYASDESFDYAYTYDVMDNPILVEDALYKTKTAKTYDIQGRLIEELQSNGYTVRYSYDQAGRISRFTYPDASSVSYDYDGSRINAIRRFSPANLESYHFEALEYDLRGKLKKGIFPLNAGAFEISYDIMGRTTNIDSTHWCEQINNYDLAGNMLDRTIQDPTGILTESFSYDELNQLIEEKGASTHKYRFDSLYNRIKEDGTKNSVNALNQILERKDRSYRYDEDGNLIQLQKTDKTLTFGYDAAGRMTSSTDGLETVFYRYDETNRRIAKINNSTTTRYIYNGQCELGTLEELRILGGLGLGAEIGDAIAIEKSGSIFIPFHDHNGNLTCLIDANTNLPTFHMRYSAFGIEMQKEGKPISWGFSSKRKDPETGLIFFGRRYYDPESGRFITKDPLGDRDGPNLYAYVSNNPLTSFDLWGLFGMSACYSPYKSYISFNGQCLESVAKHGPFFGPGRTLLMGIGRSFQGESFFSDVEANPIYRSTIGEKTMPGCANFACPGIMTDNEGGRAFAQSISKGLNGAKVDAFVNQSRGFCMDLGIAGLGILGFESRAITELASEISKGYLRLRLQGYSKPQINLTCHSRGGIEGYRATQLLPPEIRECIAIYTIGSAYLVPKDGYRDAQNYANPDDIVSKCASLYCRGNRAEIFNTGFRSNTLDGMLRDHLVESKGYQESIDRITDRMLTNAQEIR